jgi:hypothetical protein
MFRLHALLAPSRNPSVKKTQSFTDHSQKETLRGTRVRRKEDSRIRIAGEYRFMV